MDDALPAEFAAMAAAMQPNVRRLLVEGEEPRNVKAASLLHELRFNPASHLANEEAHVLQVPVTLGPAACSALRAAVDRERSMKLDSIDDAAEHELPLTIDRLRSLAGSGAVDRLLSLPSQFCHEAGRSGSDGSGGGSGSGIAPHDIFVRRYTGGTRPWIGFHADVAAVTVNCALSSEDACSGGDLLAVRGGEVARIERREGEATVHDSRLLHAVSRVRRGVRYSLICFFGCAAPGAAPMARGAPHSDAAAASATAPHAEAVGAKGTQAALDEETLGLVHEARDALVLAADALDAVSPADASSSSAAFASLLPDAQRLVNALVLAQQRLTVDTGGNGPAAASAEEEDDISTRTSTIPLPPALRHMAAVLEPGSAVALHGLSRAVLNGASGRIAVDAAQSWTGARYKVDVLPTASHHQYATAVTAGIATTVTDAGPRGALAATATQATAGANTGATEGAPPLQRLSIRPHNLRAALRDRHAVWSASPPPEIATAAEAAAEAPSSNAPNACAGAQRPQAPPVDATSRGDAGAPGTGGVSGGRGTDAYKASDAPSDVQLRVPPGLMPSPSDELRWRVLHEIGYEGGGRSAAAVSMEAFALSAADWTAYTRSITARRGSDRGDRGGDSGGGGDGSGAGGGSGGGGDGSGGADAACSSELPPPDEPPSVLQLTLFATLLVAPSSSLAHFVHTGALPPRTVSLGLLGRALVGIVDSTLAHLAATTGVPSPYDGGCRPLRSPIALDDASSAARAEIARQRRQLSRWRDAFRRRYALPADGPSPEACWAHTLLRAASLPASSMLPDEPDVAAVAVRAATALAPAVSLECSDGAAVRAGGAPTPHVEPAFLSGPSLARVRDAARALVRARCMAAGVGPAEAVDESARRCSAADLLAPSLWASLDPSLLHLTRILDRLRIELVSATRRPLLDVAELQLLEYPIGGHYRRHLDVGPDERRAVRRSVSFLLYLTDDGWSVDADGGQLIVYHAGAAPGADAATAGRADPSARGASEVVREVAPVAGTLVLFDSASVPHAVAPTRRRSRLALVGWLCEQ